MSKKYLPIETLVRRVLCTLINLANQVHPRQKFRDTRVCVITSRSYHFYVKQFKTMKVYLAVAVIALSGCLAIAKLEDGECEGTRFCIYRVLNIVKLCI